MYRVKFTDSAMRDLSSFDKPIAKRIVDRMQWFVENFDGLPHHALKGDYSDFYKLRVGDYRILYQVLVNKQIIQVHQIGHRREIYRGK
ncbi:MAG: type II toxin-antitoxin system RelE/ParE family toxin [Anaerolineales bacterium]|nr:type II toxin-antitoxin system RelE/ParE family toxin [Anaerolineales bacterium]MDP2778117.1 type II toxin-antitoxin system RelE/ParE family toxin [Anaerolineales bacterium]